MCSISLFDNQLCYSLINQIKMAKIFYSYNIPNVDKKRLRIVSITG